MEHNKMFCFNVSKQLAALAVPAMQVSEERPLM